MEYTYMHDYFSHFSKLYFIIYVHVCVCACMFGTLKGKKRGAAGFLKLDLLVLVSHYTWGLGTEPQPSARTAGALNC